MVRIISCLFLMSCRSVVFLLLHLLINLIFYPYKLYMRFLFVYWQVRFSFTLSVFGRHLFSLSILPKTKIDDQNMKFVKGDCIYLFLLFEKHQNHMHLLTWLNINAVFVIKNWMMLSRGGSQRLENYIFLTKIDHRYNATF